MCLKRAICTGSKCQSWIPSQGLWPSSLDFSQILCLVYVCFSWGAGLSLNGKAFCYPQIALPLWYWRPCLAWQIEIVAHRIQIWVWSLITLPPAPVWIAVSGHWMLSSESPSTIFVDRVDGLILKGPTIRLSKLAAVTPFCKAWKSTRAEFSKVTRKFSYRLTVKDQGWIALGQGPNRISVVKHLGPGSGPRTDDSQIKRNQQQTQKPWNWQDKRQC